MTGEDSGGTILHKVKDPAYYKSVETRGKYGDTIPISPATNQLLDSGDTVPIRHQLGCHHTD